MTPAKWSWNPSSIHGDSLCDAKRVCGTGLCQSVDDPRLQLLDRMRRRSQRSRQANFGLRYRRPARVPGAVTMLSARTVGPALGGIVVASFGLFGGFYLDYPHLFGTLWHHMAL
ncbi:hypothetical protein MES5069_310098 [Mesorhizobium escarrei]|uniref:Uncharacterized protein n=1 Tax=Mesorhizobium escarrei TaxID=666018 RepID=A0ABN8JWY3_9HYPH|nr:hypothetical protein MES5069_310098 [Mesorhizobium escarrei]